MRNMVAVPAMALLAFCAAHAGSVEVEFDPRAEVERFETWAWAPDREAGRTGVLADATMRERVERALAGCLEEAGLRAAGPDETAHVLVRYGGGVGMGKTVTLSEGFYFDGLAPAYRTLRFDEQVATVIVDLIDASTKSLVWRLYVKEKIGGPNDPPDKLQRAVGKGFSKYPPSESARARKAREIEKAERAR